MRRAAICVGILMWTAAPVFALNPALDVNQYAHAVWKIRDGFAKGAITAIAQTPDGYLWLGTDAGLFRFDGVRAIPWPLPSGRALPSDDIWSLLATADGALWVGTGKGLARWKDGRLTVYDELAGRFVWCLVEDHDHTVWASGASTPAGRLCAIDRQVKCVGDDGSLGYGVYGMYEDRRGNLWLGVTDGIWRWWPRPSRFFPMPGEADKIQAFAEDRDGTLLVSTRGGIRRFVDGRADSPPLDGPEAPLYGPRLLRDRDGALWIATTSGLVHAHERRADRFVQADGLSGNDVRAMFEDREGNVWIATSEGLDRFRDLVVTTVSERQGLSNGHALAVRAGVDGSVWLGTADSLEHWDHGRFISYHAHARPAVDNAGEIVVKGFPENGLAAIFPDDRGRVWTSTGPGLGYVERDRFVVRHDIPAPAVRSFAQDSDGDLWVADSKIGLIRLAPDGDVEQIPWAALGRKDFATTMIADPIRGGLWLGFWDGGIGRLENGRMRDTYSVADGLGQGHVTTLRLAADGSLWVGTEAGLSRVRSGTVTTLGRRNGLPCEAIQWMIHDDLGSLWMNTPCGLLRIARDQIAAWMADPTRATTPAVFDATDGARLQAGFPDGYEPFVAKATDGRLWFTAPGGVSVVDPRRLDFNPLPPPVHVERIVADGIPSDLAAGVARVDLPARTRDVQIDYTALSLVASEKVRFRYMLEGYDRDWQDAGTRRQAFYTNLSPRSYRFRVIACNNSGVWNETGATIALAIAPAYYQTTWFAALVTTALVALVWVAHKVRLQVVEKHEHEISALNERLMKAQEQERIRIAGELHDGVMQDMLAATMMLGTAKRRVAGDSDARATIDKVQEKLIQAGTDLRQLSHDLHPPLLQDAGLARAVQSYCEQFASASGIPVVCDADDTVDELSRGAALALFRIVQEALGNAAKHAAARHIRVRLARANGTVSLTVSDDGVGFDRARLAGGGGLGLVMMRERAAQLNGTFEFESAPGRGTTIRVVVPFR